MTALPSTPSVDDLIRQNRARTPKAATEARKVPRSSIAELNEMDMDEIRDRYVAHGFDGRSPTTKVLDLIDLPRNVVANVLFNATGAVEPSKVRRGALGLPSISTSDALTSMGVKNRVVRGVIGFAGDVALDPLTYIGPAGWGLQVMDGAGRAVRIGKAGAKGLKRGVREVGSGARVSDNATRELFDTLLANAPDEIKAADNARKAAYLSERAMGQVGAKSKATAPFYYLNRGLGGDRVGRGGLIAEGLTKEGAEGEAVRAFVSRAGAAAGPGIGKGGSQVAHIPFTGTSAKVKAFTRAGRAAEDDLALARSGTPRAVEEIATPTIRRARDLSNAIQAAEEAGIDATPQVEELNKLFLQAADPIAPQNPREIFVLQKLVDEAESGYKLAQAKRGGAHNKVIPEIGDADDAVDGLDDATADAVASSMQATMKAYQQYKGAVTGAVRNFAQNSPQEEMLTRAAMRFLGTDDRIVGRAAFAGPDAMLRTVKAPEPVRNLNDSLGRLKQRVFGDRSTELAERGRSLQHALGPGQRRAINTHIGGLVTDLRKAFSDAGVKPTGQDLDEASVLLMALLTKRQAERGALAAGEGVYYTTKFRSKEPAPFLKAVEDAIKSGKMSGKLNGGLMQRLEVIADKYGADLLEELQNIEVARGLLTRPRLGYVPNVPTPAASQAVAGARAYQGQPIRTAVAQRSREAFQKPRSFDQVRWIGADGQEQRLFRAELDQARRAINHPSEIQGLRLEGMEEEARALEELVARVQEFDNLPEQPRWHNTDPFEMNELAKEGRFSMMLDGIDPVGGFMQTNMLAAIANRIGAHERAMAWAEWTEYVSKFGLKAPDFRGAAVGNKIIAADGSEAQIVDLFSQNGHKVKGAIIGGQPYRPIQGVALDNPLIELLGRESSTALYHDQLAGAIERTARVMDDPERLFRGINALTQAWKNVTLLHPSWTIFNMIGDTSNALQGGVNPVHLFNPTLAKFSAKLQRYAGDPEKLRNLTVTIRGVPVTGEQIMDDLISHKVIDGTMMEETALKMVENKIFTLPSQASGTLGKIRPAVLTSDYKEAAQRYASAARRAGSSSGDKFKALGEVASDRVASNFLGPWMRFNQKVSNYLRTQVYLAYLEDGFDAGAAARKTIDSQFDYSDSTRIESTHFRTLFPFYSWMRNNGAYQVKMLLERPGYTAAFPKLHAAIEEAINGDEKVPLHQRPRWMRSALALQIGADPEKRSAVLFGGGMPVADIYQYLTPVLGTEGVMDFLHYFGSSLNPLLNVPLQLATGHETFSGRKIGPDALSGDISAGEFLRNQIRPLAEMGKVGKAIDQGGIGHGLGRVLVGGRFQDFSEERLTSSLAREFKEKEDRIRAAINRAEREGNKEKSLAGRVKLLELMNAANEAGVPIRQWASKQLQELNAQQ